MGFVRIVGRLDRAMAHTMHRAISIGPGDFWLDRTVPWAVRAMTARQTCSVNDRWPRCVTLPSTIIERTRLENFISSA